jgi:hypothetical protein
MICGEEKNGIAIKNDRILEVMRWIKRNVTRNEKRNRIVVCKECYPKYIEARKKYTSRQVLYLAIGIIFVGIGLFIAQNLGTLLLGVVIVIFLYLLSLLSYIPELDVKKGK